MSMLPKEIISLLVYHIFTNNDTGTKIGGHSIGFKPEKVILLTKSAEPIHKQH